MCSYMRIADNNFYVNEEREVQRKMANEKIKEYARKHDVKLWELSKRLGYKTDGSLTRKLRYELDADTTKYYKGLIDEIARGKKG